LVEIIGRRHRCRRWLRPTKRSPSRARIWPDWGAEDANRLF